MKIEFVVLILLLCALFLCVGTIIGMFTNEKINKRYVTEIFNIERKFYDSIESIMTEYIEKSYESNIKNAEKYRKSLGKYQYELNLIIAEAIDKLKDK